MPRLLVILLAVVLSSSGCAALSPAPVEQPADWMVVGARDAALQPQNDFSGRDIAVIGGILFPITFGIDLFILPAFISTGDDAFFFPLTRALFHVLFD